MSGSKRTSRPLAAPSMICFKHTGEAVEATVGHVHLFLGSSPRRHALQKACPRLTVDASPFDLGSPTLQCLNACQFVRPVMYVTESLKDNPSVLAENKYSDIYISMPRCPDGRHVHSCRVRGNHARGAMGQGHSDSSAPVKDGYRSMESTLNQPSATRFGKCVAPPQLD